MKKRRYGCSFSQNVFDDGKMKKYLPKETYQAIVAARKNFCEVSERHEDVYARALCRWAMKKGVTRYAHWFQPLNGLTAEKRDSLYSLCDGRTAVKFGGKQLSMSEADASSFPNGGARQTFEAKGLAHWDCTSYAFIKDGCLCIPATFTSNNCEVLDKKTPLLRSCIALNKQALRVLKALGANADCVYSVVGAEQEYFLIDKSLFDKRKDLIFTGRTLFGKSPCKGQEFADHYFRPPNQKVAEFWKRVDEELWKLGISVKTEHHEVAPNQYELAPCHTQANLACDHNQLTMETLCKVANELGLQCLLHEKPFAYVNGSGKHNNWSLTTDGGDNLFELGQTPQSHARFLLFCASVVKAVDDYAELLTLAVSSHANDCRLGGYEAPKRLLSVYLGKPIARAVALAASGKWRCGHDTLPIELDSTERNRTSPFAFTGNKFEFRMVGASASIADVNTVLNTAVAESLRGFAEALEKSDDVWQTVREIVYETFAKHKRVIFDGNSYADEWAVEAERRNLKSATTVALIENSTSAHNVNLLERHDVANLKEVLARQQILLTNYYNAVNLEGKVAVEMFTRQIAPAVELYLKTLCEVAKNKSELNCSCGREINKIEKIEKLLKISQTRCTKLKRCLKNAQQADTNLAKAKLAESEIVPCLEKLRTSVDKLERLCPETVWPLPSYEQMLFN